MRKHIQNLKNQEGMTLVELLAVIVILAIVAAIAFVLIGNVIENSKEDAHVSNAMQAIAASKIYEANGNEIDDASGVTVQTLQDKELLGALFDPWTKGEYANASTGVITKDGSGSSVKYEITGFEADGTKCPGLDGKKTETELVEDGRDNC